MSLFTKPVKQKFKEIPSTPEQDQARNYLNDLMGRQLSYPKLKIADLTGNEQMVQDQVKSYLSQAPGDFNTAANYFREVLNDQYDPETSRYYQGFRQQQQTQKEIAQNQVERSAQKAGTPRSTPALALQSQVGQNYDALINQQLGALLQDERNFKSQAGQVLPNIRGAQVGQLAAADQLAGKPREIQQLKFQAAYDKIINDMLAPYMYNAQIASQILNEPRYMGYTTGGGMTDLGFLANTASSAISSYYGAKA